VIFIHNETGNLVEILVQSLSEEFTTDSGVKLYRIGEFCIHNDDRFLSEFIMASDFYKHFTFIGFI
jgi:hypothetical protein